MLFVRPNSRVMSYYEILGVPSSSNVSEIRKAYRRLALRWHPDKNQENQQEAVENFRKISEAYEVLSDADKRTRYDMSRSAGSMNFDEWRSDFVFRDPTELFNELFSFFGDFQTRFSMRPSNESNYSDYHHTRIFNTPKVTDSLEDILLPDVPINREITVN